MRREPEDAFRSVKHGHHKAVHSHQHGQLLEDSPTGSVGPEDAADADVQAAKKEKEAEVRNAKESGEATIPIESLDQAEQEIEKVDAVIVAAEEKAGLPDSTKTTPEPQITEPSDEEEESNALLIAA